MRAGDLIEVSGTRWYVAWIFEDTRLARVVNAAGRTYSVPDTLVEDGGATHIAHPPTEWSLVVPKLGRKAGAVVSLTLPASAKRAARELTPFVDWIASDPIKASGPLLFNSGANLRPGDVLLAQLKNGTSGRIAIPPTFGSLAKRSERRGTPAKPPEPESKYDIEFKFGG